MIASHDGVYQCSPMLAQDSAKPRASVFVHQTRTINQANMRKTLGVGLVLISLVIFGLRIMKNIEFKQHVTGYLKRAAAANTLELAHEELTTAITYLEANKITSGYTSILYQTPDEDIGFWYRNLKASQNELQNLESESALEKATVLMKLRETLMDTGQRSRVTVPEGLSVYPNNKLWGALMLIACSFIFVGSIILLAMLDKPKA